MSRSLRTQPDVTCRPFPRSTETPHSERWAKSQYPFCRVGIDAITLETNCFHLEPTMAPFEPSQLLSGVRLERQDYELLWT